MRELIKLAEEKGYLNVKESKIINEYTDLCLIQKWLREEHGVHVEVNISKFRDNYISTINNSEEVLHREYSFKTYEEALEKGIKEGLKLI